MSKKIEKKPIVVFKEEEDEDEQQQIEEDEEEEQLEVADGEEEQPDDDGQGEIEYEEGEPLPEKTAHRKKLLLSLLGVKRPRTYMQLWALGDITAVLKQEIANNAPHASRQAAFEEARSAETGKVNLGKYRNGVWKTLSEEEKQPFMDEYQRLLQEWKTDVETACTWLPKKAVKPYHRFLSEFKSTVTATHPTATAGEISKLAGAEWEKIKTNADAISAYTERYKQELIEAEESLEAFAAEINRLMSEKRALLEEAEQAKQERAAAAKVERNRKAAEKRAQLKALKEKAEAEASKSVAADSAAEEKGATTNAEKKRSIEAAAAAATLTTKKAKIDNK